MIIDDNGLHLHQSDIETWMQCPEKLRLGHIASMGEETFTSDAAFVGTTTHLVIETEITSEPYESLKEAQGVGAALFLKGFEEMKEAGTTYSRETFKTDLKAMAALKPLVESWYNSPEREMLLSMDRDDFRVEWEFDLPFTQSRNGTVIWLAGRPDLVLPDRVWDWKTASGEYQQWEKQRWAFQPSVYLWAAASEGLIVPQENNTYLFEYKVLVRRQKAVAFQTVPVTRNSGTFDWLERVTMNMAAIMEDRGFENEWPLNDHSALCGPKWCPFWDSCKGKYVGKDWT